MESGDPRPRQRISDPTTWLHLWEPPLPVGTHIFSKSISVLLPLSLLTPGSALLDILMTEGAALCLIAHLPQGELPFLQDAPP